MMSRCRSRRVRRLLFAGALLLAHGGLAAGKQDYTLSIAETGNEALDRSLRESSQLESLREYPPETVFALVDRARGDISRLEIVLNSFGYYRPRIVVTVAGRDVSTPEAFATDDGGSTSLPVRVIVEPGDLYHLRRVALDGAVPDNVASVLTIQPGDPARADAVLAGQVDLLSRLHEDGYAFATVAEPVAYADDDAHVLDVTYLIGAGNKAAVGDIAFTGLERLDADFARRVIGMHTGDPYRTSSLDRARQNLMVLGVFSSVSVRTADVPDADGNASITFETGERLPRSVAFSVDYSTDLGFSFGASWLHRNLLGEAEQLTVSAAATNLGGNATDNVGYDFSAQFVKPYFFRADQQLELSAAAIKQSLDAYDQTAELFGVYLHRRYDKIWSARAGIGVIFDSVTQENTSRYYQLLSLPLSIGRNATVAGSITDVADGWRATLSLTPTASFGEDTQFFAQIQLSASIYFDLFGDGDSVLASRGLIGSIQGASSASLPPDQRLYAGGSGTVRGFRYQSIGPTFSDGDPAGAASVDAVSLEWRQKAGQDWGFVVFADAGQAGGDSLPFSGAVNIGAGVGFRYYTPIGAVRFDVAVPLTDVAQNDSFQLYISLGQAF